MFLMMMSILSGTNSFVKPDWRPMVSPSPSLWIYVRTFERNTARSTTPSFRCRGEIFKENG